MRRATARNGDFTRTRSLRFRFSDFLTVLKVEERTDHRATFCLAAADSAAGISCKAAAA